MSSCYFDVCIMSPSINDGHKTERQTLQITLNVIKNINSE